MWYGLPRRRISFLRNSSPPKNSIAFIQRCRNDGGHRVLPNVDKVDI